MTREQDERLNRAAEASQVPRSRIIAMALTAFLPDFEARHGIATQEPKRP